jgi:leader peptidase (prepilin peptidase)/N-methyltransferase
MGAATGFLFLLLPFLISFLFYPQGGMGEGDIKLGILIGLATGFPLALLALVIGAILGGLVASVLLLLRIKGRKEAIPFGPFLSLATIVTLLWGSDFLGWYLGLLQL